MLPLVMSLLEIDNWEFWKPVGIWRAYKNWPQGTMGHFIFR